MADGNVAVLLLKLAMAGVFSFWILMMILRSTRPWTHFNKKITPRLTTSVYGDSAAWMLLFDAPVFVFMLLCALVLKLKPDKVPKPLGKGRRPRVGVWNYPVLTRGPLGIVSMGELLGLLLFLAFLGFVFGSYTEVGFSRLTANQRHSGELWQMKLGTAATRLGLLGYVAMAFLFFPVSRGSVLLHFINVPFERAVKYHKWVGVISMVIFTAHGLAFIALWRAHGVHILRDKVVMWNRIGCSNLAGVISLLAGILIVFTSIPQLRARFFEAFYYTHHLYIVFVAFAMMHVGEKQFTVVMAGVFLFFLDRFLRFMQSRRSVDLLAVRNLPGGTMELTFAKHPAIQYSAASFIFLQLPRLDGLQWHPFTLSSSSLTEPDRITILVKRQGSWTRDLEKMVEVVASAGSSDAEQKTLSCPFGFKAAIEGPYGHQSSYFLKYDAILFVAGGSGVSPFISILKDLVHRYQNQQPGLPTDVTLVWSVRKSDELHLLDTVEVSPSASLNLHIIAHVTREDGQHLQDMESVPLESMAQVYNSTPSLDPLYGEVGRDSLWGGVAVMVASLIGFLFVWGFIGHYYINQGENEKDYPSWAKGLFSLLSMFLGITVFGGGTSLLWSWVYYAGNRKAVAASKSRIGKEPMGFSPSTEMRSVRSLEDRLLKRHNIHYGCRPNLEEIFKNAAKRLAGSNVGVMVCGPPGLQQSVAHQCQANSSLFGGPVAFHFHSVSFEL